MDHFKLSSAYSSHPHFALLAESLSKPDIQKIHLKGLYGSSSALLLSACYHTTGKTFFAVLPEKESAAFFYNDLAHTCGHNNVLFFPSSHRRSIQYDQPDNSNIVLRTEVLNFLSISMMPKIIVSYPEAIAEKVITKTRLESNTLRLRKGDKISMDFLTDVLNEYDFERTDFVVEPGQFAVRGSIIDVFSFSSDHPYRVDFFGEEVESIRTFGVENQLSKEQFEEIMIVPDIQKKVPEETAESFLHYLGNDIPLWITDVQLVTERINQIYESVFQKFNIPEFREKYVAPQKVVETGNSILDKWHSYTVMECGFRFFFPPSLSLEFDTSLQPPFNKNFNILSDNLKENHDKGYRNFILSENDKQIERLQSIFSEIKKDVPFSPLLNVIHEGFIDHHLKICCYTDHQIFDKYHRFQLKKGFSREEAINLRELQNLHTGDYVVHIDHGIGIFGGLDMIEVLGRKQEAVRLIFKDNDILYVNIHSLHRISKYKGKDATPPAVSKLGTAAWKRMTQNTKKKVKDIARDLISLYARRKSEKGFEYSPDSFMQHELEASFIYEDTPDQVKTTKDVKADMESSAPMDRLICGDVGFGKTEIAVRASFKAVADNKQVALLAPTTLLALQHYNTFSERLKNFPCTVDYISRLRSTRKQKETLKKTAEGKVDILIGTHRIVSKDIVFKNLGLLIVDEEQKFGVGVKEKLKQLKINVDTLTLTATPIPRTLQFSLLGARDLSIISTPPPNRHPIQTELHTLNEDILRDAIEYETGRNGQVFFIHNRVQNIPEIEALVKKICPNVRTAVAHGQMEGSKLENIMIEFILGDYDVLIATAIIESGLDIPNVNTIIINNAHEFGLSDLHQLRGRVGRSNKKAFCYLIAPPLSVLTQEARRRLTAIMEYSELGSGFNIAMQDLDIRGAGNILGAEQSGFIADIGFETYNKILSQAIAELKESEFKELFQNQTGQDEMQETQFTGDCHIDTDMELLFPDSYIDSPSERIKLYRELDGIDNEEKLLAFAVRLEDRFGKLPQQSLDLLNVVRLRWKAIRLGFEKILLKNNLMIAFFISDPDSLYYKSNTFAGFLNLLNNSKEHAFMQEKNNKLTLTFSHVVSIQDALSRLDYFLEELDRVYSVKK